MKEELTIHTAQIIQRNRYGALGTTNGKAAWVVPLYYCYDDDLNFYFYSFKESRHSHEISKCCNVGFAIYDAEKPSLEADGIQIEANCYEVDDEKKLHSILSNYIKRVQKSDPDFVSYTKSDIKEYLGKGDKRFYRIQPTKIYKLHPEADSRVEIELAALQEVIRKSDVFSAA